MTSARHNIAVAGVLAACADMLIAADRGGTMDATTLGVTAVLDLQCRRSGRRPALPIAVPIILADVLMMLILMSTRSARWRLSVRRSFRCRFVTGNNTCVRQTFYFESATEQRQFEVVAANVQFIYRFVVCGQRN
jgi:hypothetical protein